MLAIAARYADIWDTFPTIPATATAGVAADLPERVERFDDACRAAGRDPLTVRRSTWGTGSVVASPGAFVDFVERHRRLGFTDFNTPLAHDLGARRAIAQEVIPALRASAPR